MERETWDSYFMRIALMAASRATCTRRKVGAALVQDRSVRGTGYNGAPRGVTSCIEAGECLLDDAGKCKRTVHAETNVILQTDAREREGATVYATDRPCWNCALVLANSGITEIVYLRPFWDSIEQFEALMTAAGITARAYEPGNSLDLTMEEAQAVLGVAASQPGQVTTAPQTPSPTCDCAPAPAPAMLPAPAMRRPKLDHERVDAETRLLSILFRSSGTGATLARQWADLPMGRPTLFTWLPEQLHRPEDSPIEAAMVIEEGLYEILLNAEDEDAQHLFAEWEAQQDETLSMLRWLQDRLQPTK
jgi:dCMP deaminase